MSTLNLLYNLSKLTYFNFYKFLLGCAAKANALEVVQMKTAVTGLDLKDLCVDPLLCRPGDRRPHLDFPTRKYCSDLTDI